MPRNVGILCLGLIGMILSGCGGPDDSKDHEIKNVLIMLVDTLRADHLGAYGYDRATSPNIDLLAAESVQFERAFSVSPWTRTSVVSMFTSMYPIAHGCQDKEDVASPQLTMMAEVFKANGFKTIGFSSNIGVSEDFNVVQGFDDFTYFRREPWFESHPSRTDLGYVPIEGMIPAAINALDEIGDSPFFLYFTHWIRIGAMSRLNSSRCGVRRNTSTSTMAKYDIRTIICSNYWIISKSLESSMKRWLFSPPITGRNSATMAVCHTGIRSTTSCSTFHCLSDTRILLRQSGWKLYV